jgi:uncharacterized repeat protein (TIGR03803 family)
MRAYDDDCASPIPRGNLIPTTPLARLVVLTFALLFGLAGAFPARAVPAAAPVFSPAAGTYVSAPTVTISTSSSGATISYTTDGSTPTETNGTTYAGPVSTGGTTLLKAIAYGNGFGDSSVTSGLYTVTTAPGAVLNVLHDFPATSGDGVGPLTGLLLGSDGNFYGTTAVGGSSNDGTVFKITPGGVLTILVSFNGTNGVEPYGASLIQGTDGNFYGTTYIGGSVGYGTVFEMTPTGTLTTLASFNGTNGIEPDSLLQGSDSNFYGTTSGGGKNDGTVFKLTPGGILTTLVSFNGTTGIGPNSLLQGSDGNFYGTTGGGGGGGYGTAFMITPAGVLTTLVSFNGANGASPTVGLIAGSDGNFYGTTGGGGSYVGTAYKMTPSGALTTLYSFNFNTANGVGPEAGMVLGRDGNFYGTTGFGGPSFDGTVFKMTPAGAVTTLAVFDRANGAYQVNGIVQGTDGNFYGTAQTGGSSNDGVVFQVIVPPSPPSDIPAMPAWAIMALLLLLFSVAAVSLPRQQRPWLK